jgi:Dihydrodipicolinate reductase, N-terminus.
MNLGIFGATGRLGRIIGAETLKHPDIRITAALGRSSIGEDYGSF